MKNVITNVMPDSIAEEVGIEENLCGQEDVAAGKILLYRAPDILLARTGRIAIGRIKKVDAQAKGVFHYLFAFLIVQRPIKKVCIICSEAHASQA